MLLLYALDDILIVVNHLIRSIMRQQLYAWVLCLSVIAKPVQALTVYEWVDVSGQTHYSEKPVVGANQIVIDESKWEQHLTPHEGTPRQVMTTLRQQFQSQVSS